jgi:hypothetical protein
MRKLIGEFVGLPVRAALVGVLLCAATATAAVVLKPLTGEPITGELISLSDKGVVLKVDGKAVLTPIKETLQIDIVSPPKEPGKDAKYTNVKLIDGTLLHCEQVTFRGNNLSIKLLSGQTATIPMKLVGYVLKEAHDPTFRDQWADCLARETPFDQLVAKIDGPPPVGAVLNSLRGTFGPANGTGETIQFTPPPPRPMASVKLAQIHGMIFQPAVNPKAAPLLCKVYDTNGNIYTATALTLEGEKASLTTTTGVEIELPRAALARLDYSGGKFAYLSDLPLDKKTLIKPPEPLEHLRFDHNLDDGPIQLNGVHYDKGLSIHSFTRLDFPLGGDFREFKAVIGVDDLVGGIGRPTIVKIEGDGKELMKQAFSRKDQPKDVTLNVLNVKTLRITVLSDELLDLGHHVDLANARVSK